MRARAPGKLVLSGAYAVLDGAPAVVAAVDRYVAADAARRAERVTPELREAIGEEAAPWFDASALREGEHKLGLGSSAAILVASLAARELAMRGQLADAELAEAVLEPALAAHARAQGGGSGVDVAASALGGVFVFRRGSPRPAIASVTLPSDLVVETWWSGAPAVTSGLVGRVRDLGRRNPELHAERLGAQAGAAEAAERALLLGSARDFVSALVEQRRALSALGAAAGVEIVTGAAAALAEIAEADGACALPSGAGGGDVLVFTGLAPSSPSFRALAERHRHRLLNLSLGARGVHSAAYGDSA